MVNVVTKIEIARPRDEVAAYASDPDNAPRWYRNRLHEARRPIMAMAMRRANWNDLREIKRILEAQNG